MLFLEENAAKMAGTEFDQFQDLFCQMCDSTSVIHTNSNNLAILSYEREDDEFIYFLMFDRNSGRGNILEQIHPTKISKLNIFHDNLMDDLRREKYAFYDKARKLTIFPSELLATTFTQEFKLKGKFFFEPCIERNLAFARELRRDKDVNLLLRNENSHAFKLMGFVTDCFCQEERSLISSIKMRLEKSLGKMLLCNWSMTPTQYSIYMEFEDLCPQIEYDYYFGVLLQSSNVMRSSFYGKLILKVGKANLPVDSIMVKHSTIISADKVADYLISHVSSLYDAEEKLFVNNNISFHQALRIAHDTHLFNYLCKKKFCLCFKGLNDCTNNYEIIKLATNNYEKYVANKNNDPRFSYHDRMFGALNGILFHILDHDPFEETKEMETLEMEV